MTRKGSRPDGRASAPDQPLDEQRIDKWLWHARLVRTRAAATALANAGRVRVNGQRVSSAARRVSHGDVVTLSLSRVRVLRVAGIAERRGDADAAAELYDEVNAANE